MNARMRIGVFVVFCLFGFYLSPTSNAAELVDLTKPKDQLFLAEFPELEKYRSSERDTNIRFGVGISPFQVVRNRVAASVSIFQFHWKNEWFDWEIFSANFSKSISGEQFSKMNLFTFRSIPKYRLTETISIGPLVGYELISFPDVDARLNKNNFFAPFESFSTRGWIVGAGLSQTFPIWEKYELKLNQIFYRQFYDTVGTNNGWEYFYRDTPLNLDQGPIAPGSVIMIEVSLLY